MEVLPIRSCNRNSLPNDFHWEKMETVIPIFQKTCRNQPKCGRKCRTEFENGKGGNGRARHGVQSARFLKF